MAQHSVSRWQSDAHRLNSQAQPWHRAGTIFGAYSVTHHLHASDAACANRFRRMMNDLEQCTHSAHTQAGLAVLCCIEVLQVSSSTQHMHCPMQMRQTTGIKLRCPAMLPENRYLLGINSTFPSLCCGTWFLSCIRGKQIHPTCA